MDLHALIEQGDVEAVSRALVAGADVDVRTAADHTPLFTAMRIRSLPMVELLLGHGADPNAIQEDRSTWERDQAQIERLEGRGNVADHARSKAVHKASPRTVFSASVSLWGNVQLVQRLIDAGARLDAVDPRGWTPLHFAAHGRAHSDVLELLVASGADLHARNQDGHTPLALCCLEWRSTETQCLMRLGAPLSEIGWTELHLGALRDALPAPRDPTVELEAVDIHGRTALHIAFQHRNETAMHELLELGANPRTAHPWHGPLLRMALAHAAPALLDRLVPLVDVNERSGNLLDTALMDNLEDPGHVRRLLEAGADPDLRNDLGETAFQLEHYGNFTVLSMLRPGSDWSPLKADSRARFLGDPDLELAAPPTNAHRWRVFGTKNPTNMSNPWWASLVLTRAAAYAADDVFSDHERAGPVWCAERFGQSLTRLPDGRFIEIGGEHEDGYDSNFCIYNDVIVHHPDGRVQIFGYPRDVFPPTDHHSATLVGSHIYIIGNLGYGTERREGFTPVYRLCLDTGAMSEVPCTGESPGWIHRHEAALVDGCIHVCVGQIYTKTSRSGSRAKSRLIDNPLTYALDLNTRGWRRLD